MASIRPCRLFFLLAALGSVGNACQPSRPCPNCPYDCCDRFGNYVQDGACTAATPNGMHCQCTNGGWSYCGSGPPANCRGPPQLQPQQPPQQYCYQNGAPTGPGGCRPFFNVPGNAMLCCCFNGQWSNCSPLRASKLVESNASAVTAEATIAHEAVAATSEDEAAADATPTVLP